MNHDKLVFDLFGDAPKPKTAAKSEKSKPAPAPVVEMLAAPVILAEIAPNGARIVSEQEWNEPPWLFRCLSNPNAPVTKMDMLEDAWQLREHSEYQRVDAQGRAIVTAEWAAREEIRATSIPLRQSGRSLRRSRSR